MNKYFLPYDIYERHRKVGSLIEPNKTVLDIGGELNQLSQFCKPKKITVANLKDSIEKSDVAIKKNKLSFPKDSFDVVTAIDVLEHVPKKERLKFIDSLKLISKNIIIISFPLGTKNHIEYEKEIEKWLENKNQEITYLKEHISLGLPSEEEIREIIKNENAKLLYSG